MEERSSSEILQDAELEKLYNETNFANLLESQRYNILTIGNRTGFRPESLQRMHPETFKEHPPGEDGRIYMTIVMGTMKNLPGDVSKVDAALFRQQVFPCSDKRFCPIEAYRRQCSLLEGAPKGDYLFRAVRYCSKQLGADAAGDGIFRGVGLWASKVLERKLTFKDVARRVVMTKLANSNEITPADAAKYLGVTTPTLGVYHQMGKAAPNVAANILSRAPANVLPPSSSTSVDVPINCVPLFNGVPINIPPSTNSSSSSLGDCHASMNVLAPAPSIAPLPPSTATSGTSHKAEASPSTSTHVEGGSCVFCAPFMCPVPPSTVASASASASAGSTPIDPPVVMNPAVLPSTSTQADGDGGSSRQSSVDLLDLPHDVDSDWDHETNPLTQPSAREALESARMTYREQAYSAPASPAGSKVTQDLSATCNPFVSGKKGAKKGVKHDEPTPDLPCCFICDQVIPLKTCSSALKYLKCDGCFGTFHRGCAGLAHEPRYNSFPCPLGCNPKEPSINNVPAKKRKA